VALKCDLEKFTAWAKTSGYDDLIKKVLSLQDLLYQQKEATCVQKLVDARNDARLLTTELARQAQVEH